MVVHFIDKALENLVPYIPLMQSLLWPLILLIFLFLFRNKLGRILAIIIDRLESGSSVEAGPLKLGAKLTTPSREERERKDQVDLADAGPLTSSPDSRSSNQTLRPRPTIVNPDSYMMRQDLARFHQIENAALSRISASLGIPITREVKPSPSSSILFDGVALDPKGFRIVEVKIYFDVKQVKMTIKRFLDSVSSFCLSLEEKNRSFVSVILVVVIRDDFRGDPGNVARALSSAIEGYTFPIRVEQFQEKDLQGDQHTQPEDGP